MTKPSLDSDRGLLICLVILGIVVMAMTAAAEPATISSSGPSEAEPGTQVTVSYTLTNTGENKSAYILDLSLPANWTVANHTDANATWKPADNDWLWQTIQPDESVSPSVTLNIPADANLGTYTVNGTIKSDGIEGTTNHSITVQRQTTASPTPPPTSPPPNQGNVAVNLTVSPMEVDPGETVTVTPTLTNTRGNESAYILDLSVPANWTVVNRINDNGIWQPSDNDWLWQTVEPGDSVSPSVTLEVPNDTENGTYNIEAIAKSTDGNETITRSVAVSQRIQPPTDRNVSVNLSVSPPETTPGEAITVAPTLTNTGENASAYILDLSLPTNWTIVTQANDSGTWQPSDNDWLWQTVQPGETVSPSLTLNVPNGTTPGTYSIEATAKSTDGNATATQSVLVQTPPRGGKGRTEALIEPFSNTTALTPNQLEDNSLSGKIRVERPVAENTTVDLLRSSSTNYSIAITAPDSAENVTFYLQTRAITASQNIEDLVMYLDGERHPFVVNESAGPGKSPWVTFNVPQFSTRTVSFTTTGDRLIVDADGRVGNYTRIQAAVNNASDGDIVEVRPGTYREQVTVNNDTIIVAPDGAVLNGSTFTDPVAFELNAPATVAGFTIRKYGLGISATSETSDWVLRDSVLRNNSVGIRAPSSTGNWTVQNTTIRSSAIGIYGSETTGNWSVINSTIIGSAPSATYEPYDAFGGTGIYAVSTSGSWEVHTSTIVDNSRHGINATGADPAGNATDNWWGDVEGPDRDDCVGNVRCTPALSNPPDAAAFAVAIESTNTPVTEGQTLSVTANVTNIGSDPGTQTIIVENFADETIASEAISLNASESRTVTLEWQTDESDAGSGNVTIVSATDSATAPVVVKETIANFEVTIKSTNTPVTEGGILSVTANVTNTGNDSGSQNITLSDFTGDQVDSRVVSITADESQTVTLEWMTDKGDAGSGMVTVASTNDSATTTVEVERAIANVTLVNASLSRRVLTAGDSIYINATVTNTGQVAGNITLGFYRENNLLSTNTVSVPAGEIETVRLEQPFTTAGTYDIRVENESTGGRSITAGTVVVNELQSDQNVTVNLSVSPSQATPGETVTVTPTLTNTGSDASAYILDLSLPTNWTIVNRTNAGGSWQPSDNDWLWQTVEPGGSVSPSVTLEVPNGTENGTYSIEAMAKSTDGNATATQSVLVQTPPRGGKGRTEALIEPFSNTTALTRNQLEDNSLSGKIRVERPVAENTTVDLLRSSSTNYSIAITAPDNAENVTFYLQKRAISASQNIEDLTMYLDSEQHPFVVNESTGPGESPWVAFNIPHFSTRTVSFTDSGETLVVNDDGNANYTSIQNAVDNATSGDTVEVRPGTYEEPVDIKKNITLIAPDGATVTNTSAVTAEYGTIEARYGIQLHGPISPLISGFTLTGWQTAFSTGNTEGDWVLHNTTITNSSLGVEANGTGANWTIANVSIRGGTYGVSVYGSSGDWQIRNSSIEKSTTGVLASHSSGDWSIRNTLIVSAEDAVSADQTEGAWLINATTLRGNQQAVEAMNTTGSWEIHWSSFRNNSEGIDATNASIQGNATYNWWGDVDGPDADDCVGNVRCTPALSSPPDAVAFAVTIESTNTPVTEGEALSVTVNVTNVGSESGSQTISLRNFAGVEVANRSISLDASASRTVVLEWQTDESDDGSGTVTVASGSDSATAPVTIEEATANFNITIESTNAPVTAGETLTVTANVTNNGNDTGTQTIVLRNFSDVQVGSRTVTLNPDESTTVQLEWTTNNSDTGSGTVTVASANDSATATVAVEKETANVTLVNASLSRKVLTSGSSIYINATVNNTGQVAGNITLGFYRDNNLLFNHTVRVPAGESKTVRFEQTFTTAGTYDITIENQSAGGRSITPGTVVVNEPQTETGTGAPGFGFAPAFVALLGAIFIFRWRY